MRNFCCLSLACLSMLFAVTAVNAQEVPAYAVVDGTQTTPQIVFSDVAFAIADNGTGNYTRTFPTPPLFLLGTPLSQGPAFDVAPTFISAVRDSSDKRRVKVYIRGLHTDVDGVHVPQDATFSLKFILTSPLIYEDGFE